MSFDSYSEGETEPILRVPEEEFDSMMHKMDTKDLIDTVILLQKEMTAEQDHFNMLSQQVGQLTEGSPEYEEVAEEIVASQSRLAMLMGRNMKCFTQQTTLQNQELMQGFDDGQPNGDLSSSEEEELNGYPSRVNPGTSYIHSNQPNLVNGHSSRTYQNNGDDLNEPVVRKGVPSRDFFSDSDSFPSLPVTTSGGGEPDICDEETEYCDFDDNVDQNQNQGSNIGGGGDGNVKEGVDDNDGAGIVEIDEQYTSQHTNNIRDPTYYDNETETVHSQGHGGSAIDIHSKENHNSIDSLAHHERNSTGFRDRNGAIPTEENKTESLNTCNDSVAQDNEMDGDELVVSISGSGRISLAPADEKRKPKPSIQKGSYIGPAELNKPRDNEFIEQKKRFAQLRQKFSETENGSDSDSKPDRQSTTKVDSTPVAIEEVPLREVSETELTVRPEDPDTVQESQNASAIANAAAADKKRSEISMVLSIKTRNIHDNDQQKTSPNVSDEIKDSTVGRRTSDLAELGKQSNLQDSRNQETEPTMGEGQQAEHMVGATSVKSLANNIEQKTGHIPSPSHPSPVAKSVGSFTLRASSSSPSAPGKLQSSAAAEGHTQDTTYRRVLTTLEVKQVPPQKPQEVTDGRNSPFLVIEDEDVAELVVGKPVAMGNEQSQIKEPVRQKEDTEDQGESHDLVKEVKVIEKVNGHGVKVDPLPPVLVPAEGFTGDEKVKERTTLKDWDPTSLFTDLYQVKLEDDHSEEGKMEYVNMEGYMEKLPINKKKATLLKTWKRRFFKAEDGVLYYYESQEPTEEDIDDIYSDEETSTQSKDKVNGSVQLNGGTIEELGGRMLGIDDSRGNYLVVRCPTDREFEDWKCSLETQIVDIKRTNYVRPVLRSCAGRKRKVILVDIGSCSVRAGILGDNPSLPHVFFPCVMATDKETGDRVFGIDALKPDIRSRCVISYPVRPAVKADKFAIDINAMPALFNQIFKDLKVDPSKYWVMFSTPGNFSDKIKEQFMDILVNRFNVIGANIVNQTLLALYSYNSTTGVVVDVGERLEIVPVTDGYIVESGVTRQPYGGHRITEALNASFTESKYRFFTDVEFPIVRLAMEKSCYVSTNYKEDEKKCEISPEEFRATVDLTNFNLPKDTWTHVTHDLSRFKSAEGLFNTELWGMDNPSLHKLVQKAVHACPLDFRRTMWRSIYLSGGVTLLPGFAERLQSELQAVVPPTIKVQVHASPQRYHSAYIGACTLSNLSVFEQSCITGDEWRQQGAPCLRKWHMY